MFKVSKIILLIGLVLLMQCMFFAAAESSLSEIQDLSELFTPQYVDPGDLGDENMPLPLLYSLAGISAAGAIIIHRKRIDGR